MLNSSQTATDTAIVTIEGEYEIHTSFQIAPLLIILSDLVGQISRL